MNTLLSIAAAFVAAAAFAAPASAQMLPNAQNGYDMSGMGMPDFTNTDITGMNRNWEVRQNEAMDQATANIIAQVLSNPYAVQVMQSGACGYGSPQQLAYVYAATAGCTREGIHEYGRVTDGIIQRDNDMWRAMNGGQ